MQIVIEMPDYYYKQICGDEVYMPLDISVAIKNGTSLPKGHGRLIDAEALTDELIKTTGKRFIAVDTAPTILEAKGESE